jgi:hypothetical protein
MLKEHVKGQVWLKDWVRSNKFNLIFSVEKMNVFFKIISLQMFFVFTTSSDAISIGIFLSPQTAQPHDFNWSKTRRSAKSYAETERLNAPKIVEGVSNCSNYMIETNKCNSKAY